MEVDGRGARESTGRWSTESLVRCGFAQSLHGQFDLYLSAVGHGANAGTAISVTVEGQTQYIKLTPYLGPGQATRLRFDLASPSDALQIGMSHGEPLAGENRSVGVGFLRMKMVQLPTALEARDADGSPAAGVDFTTPHLPGCIESASGLGEVEMGGRWSVGLRTIFELTHRLGADSHSSSMQALWP